MSSRCKEYAYFTYAKANGNGKKDELDGSGRLLSRLRSEGDVLTLHFTLPFKTPVKAQALDLEIYDPDFFIDFAFAEKDPVRLVERAGAQCCGARWREAA